MSAYYKQKFVSPVRLYAEVQEELRSYFESSMVDNTMFPVWTNQCIQKLGLAAFPIKETIMSIQNFQHRLSDDFHAVREAWSCSTHEEVWQLPSALYQQITPNTKALITSRLDVGNLYCDLCQNCQYPDVIQAIYKTTEQVAFQFRKTELLTPGNINTSCPKDLWCANWNAVSKNSYDIRDNKLVTTFCDGIVYMLYYSDGLNSDAEQLVPDSYYTKEFIKAFLKQKLFEQIFNQTTDETFNQSQQKYSFYKSLADESYILADVENKKETVYRKQRKIKQTLSRNQRYEL